MSSGPAVRLEIPSRIEMLEAADVLVGQLAAATGFDDDARHAIEIAGHEAVINAILHGNQRDATRHVRIDLALRPAGLEIRVQDEGPGFDATRVPDPLAPENVAKPSGRGILLMRALMDEVTFRRAAHGGTEVRMLKRCGAWLTRRLSGRRVPPGARGSAHPGP